MTPEIIAKLRRLQTSAYNSPIDPFTAKALCECLILAMEALEFYSNLGTHGTSAMDMLLGRDSPIHIDMGKNGRKALSQIADKMKEVGE